MSCVGSSFVVLRPSTVLVTRSVVLEDYVALRRRRLHPKALVIAIKLVQCKQARLPFLLCCLHKLQSNLMAVNGDGRAILGVENNHRQVATRLVVTVQRCYSRIGVIDGAVCHLRVAVWAFAEEFHVVNGTVRGEEPL